MSRTKISSGGWFGRQGVVEGANLCRLAIIEKGEIPGREVRNQVTCRIGHDDVNGEEALVHDGIGGAQGRERLLRSERISQRMGLRACPASSENDQACDKSCALRVESTHHDCMRPGDSRRV